ncbi:MAG TPA: hypothetical protein PKA41_00370 [Verrucomicrobiota bacterium]|nr:hypothetical protein [Verrucomicrobiota bacterium]
MVKLSPLSKVTLYQSVGFIVIITLIMLDELVALPSLIFGDRPFIVNFQESTLKMLLILGVWFLVARSTRRILARVRQLERFMRICAWCHQIDFDGEWIPLEELLRKGFDTRATHGICPTCFEREQRGIKGEPDCMLEASSTRLASHQQSA